MRRVAIMCALLLMCAAPALAQIDVATPAALAVQSEGALPRLVKFSGTLAGTQGTVSVTFALYKDQAGGTLLWQEVQPVTPDANGRYAVYLGAATPQGIPLDVFASGDARWLEVQVEGQTPQPRVMFVSVPYALAAGDAQTLGGKPASAYAPATDATKASGGTRTLTGTGATGSALVGTNSFSTDGVNVQFTDTSGTLTGYSVQNLGSGASSYSGMLFFDDLGNLGQFQGFNNSTHEYRINNIAKNLSAVYDGSINFMIGSSSKFFVGSTGKIGIGTSTPAFPLDVAGSLSLARFGNSNAVWIGSNSPAVGFNAYFDANAFAWKYGSAGTAGLIYNDTGGLTFQAGPSAAADAPFSLTSNRRMTIKPTGTVEIPGIIKSTATGGGVDFQVPGLYYNGVKWIDGSGTMQAHIFRYGLVDNNLYVSNGGLSDLIGVYLAPSATSWTSTSDESLKSDIEPVTGILDKIRKIRVVSYNMASLSTDSATGKIVVRESPKRRMKNGTVIKQQIGSIAQDWLANFPELVVEPQTGNQYYGLDYDRIGVVALGAAKELNTLVAQKDAEIKALNARLAALEQTVQQLKRDIERQSQPKP